MSHLNNISTLNGSAMPSLVYGLTGDLRQYHARVTGTQEEYTRKRILLTSIILNITDTLRSLVIKISYHSGKQRNGIRINSWNCIERQVQNTLSAWVLITTIFSFGLQNSIDGMQLIWVPKRMLLEYGSKLRKNRVLSSEFQNTWVQALHGSRLLMGLTKKALKQVSLMMGQISITRTFITPIDRKIGRASC